MVGSDGCDNGVGITIGYFLCREGDGSGGATRGRFDDKVIGIEEREETLDFSPVAIAGPNEDVVRVSECVSESFPRVFEER